PEPGSNSLKNVDPVRINIWLIHPVLYCLKDLSIIQECVRLMPDLIQEFFEDVYHCSVIKVLNAPVFWGTA
ncbi:MAG: hypothetical protein IKD85_02060, partial [Firmicutes bacterium]|nr:hypothetical protein [Bacillota bacterium]